LNCLEREIAKRKHHGIRLEPINSHHPVVNTINILQMLLKLFFIQRNLMKLNCSDGTQPKENFERKISSDFFGSATKIIENKNRNTVSK